MMLLPLLFSLVQAFESTGGGVYSGREGQLKVALPRIEASIDIDGHLDEAPWGAAARLTGFSQYAPVDGRAATRETEVLVWYSPSAIHFGIRAQAPPADVRATLANRDKIDADDHVQIFLSPFNDGRQALMFAVNPLGVQADGALVEGTTTTGGSFEGLSTSRETADLSPDFVFDSKGRLTDTGYEVEIRIPFKSLRYPQAETQDWGIHVVRRVQSLGHEDTWTPARRAAASFLAQGGTLVGLTGLHPGLVLDLNPIVTAHADGAPRASGGWAYDSGRPEVGGNVRWGMTSNLTLTGTVNPDFSQVESDAGQFT
ncbi:MAG: carbohydrate binding family 9 domain-containing protein, partial [bacterium]